MTRYMTVRLTPWATDRINKNYGAVNKMNLRKSLKDFPDTEFHTVSTPEFPRDGAVVTVREAHAAMVDVMEVRYARDTQVAMLTIHPSGGVIVS